MGQRVSNDSTGIVFKGYRSGLILIIPEEGAFQIYLQELEEHLNKARSFFKGAKVTVQTGSRELSEPEQTALFGILNEHGLVVQQLQNNSENEVAKNLNQKGKKTANEFINTITVKKTVRSGQKIQFEGNLLIIGDVNPGAEVIASGDIVVLGKLRGIAHAGADGNSSAQIFALQLNPVQIRIADIFTRDSEKNRGFKNSNSGPEVARIKDKMIVVERYNC
ncbi:MAG TPA: septum site-determining protein MinC [Bacillota bacterium]